MKVLHILIAFTMLFGSACGKGKTDNAAILSEHLLRSVRLERLMYDSMGEGIQYQEWHDGSFKLIGEFAWKPVEHEGSKVTLRMQRLLVIPNAPWTGQDGAKTYIQAPDGKTQCVGESAWVNLKSDGGTMAKHWLKRSTMTGERWVGLDRDKIIAGAPGDAMVQLGTLGYRDIKLEDGRLAKKVCMTKGTGKDDVWEGEVDNATYRETPSGVAIPIQIWEYRNIKLQDGRETVLLMARPVKGGAWVGVHDGKVYRQP